MNQEATEAIRIADKHLAGRPPEARAALAKEIIAAITDHAQRLIDEMFGPQRHKN